MGKVDITQMSKGNISLKKVKDRMSLKIRKENITQERERMSLTWAIECLAKMARETSLKMGKRVFTQKDKENITQNGRK